MKKRILSLLLCGALMFSLCFQSALAAGNGQAETECICTSLCTTETIEEDCPVCGAENADFALCEGEAETAVLSNAEAVNHAAKSVDVPYLDANGSQQNCNSYTAVDTTTTTWNEGWYVAEGDVTIPDSVTLTGDVHLILTDGCSLTVDGGISGNEDSALTIYAQSTGDEMGSLTVTGGGQTEGVSTGIFVNGEFTLNGGTVTATGGAADNESNGIRANSGIKISGGSITATGGSSEGMSTGLYAEYGVEIFGGTVTATGDRAKYESNGIFSYYGVEISGGSITAIGGSSEGISTGIRANSGIEISGGSVTATGGAVTASGDSTQITSEGIVVINGDITIKGGSVTATGGAATGGERATSHGIYVIGEPESSACNITITGNAQVTATAGPAVAESGPAVAESCGIVAICIVTGVGPEEQGPVGSITIADNAQVIATGGTVTGGEMPFSYGIGASGGITVNSGHVIATGGMVTGDEMAISYGIYAYRGIAVNGGHVIAGTQATSKTHSALGAAPALPNTTYWWRTAATDEFTTSDDSEYVYNDTHTYVEVKVKELICAITFDPNGGVVNPTDAITNIYGRLTNLPTPTRSGSYRFDGWYTAAEGGIMVTTEAVFTEDATIYAHWSYNGGSGGGTSVKYNDDGKVVISAPKPGNYKITIASYSGESLLKVQSADITLESWVDLYEITDLNGFDTTGADKVKVFFWDTEMRPQCDAAVKTLS